MANTFAPLRRLEDFFFRKVDSAAIVPLRICLGLSFFAYYVTCWDQVGLLYSADGVAGVHFPGLRPILGIETAWIAWGLALASSASYTVGFWTRTSGFVFLLTNAYLAAGADPSGWGWHATIKPLFLWSLFANPGAYRSIDEVMARRKGLTLNKETYAFPFRLLQLHATCIYLAASVHRLNDDGWLRGDMIFYALDMSVFSRFPMVDFAPFRRAFEPLCWGALVIEILGIVAPWFSRARPILIGLILMHAGLEILVTTGRWQVMMIGLLWTILRFQNKVESKG